MCVCVCARARQRKRAGASEFLFLPLCAPMCVSGREGVCRCVTDERGIFARLVREEAGLLGEGTRMEHHMHTHTCTVNQAALSWAVRL